MADFVPAQAKTGAHEKGYANIEGDAGGETYAGITRKNWPLCAIWRAVDGCKARLGFGDGHGLDAHHLGILNACIYGNPITIPTVSAFYKSEYWDALHLDAEPDQLIAEKAFDIAVNMGVPAAKTMLANAKDETSDA